MSRHMISKVVPTAVLALLASLSPFLSSPALAQADLPGAVGRISSVQGQVTLSGDDEPMAATLNWPVTGASHLTTASGARTEFRVGSTAVRLDGDSDLEITDIDDDLLRLRLNYGSVNIRVRNRDMLRDFELSTPQARITMIEPGVLRVDVERVPDTSQISVLAGMARVDGAGSSFTVNVGYQADISNADARTLVARRDGFDVWADERDRQADMVSTQYVSTGMTGYEELDRHGSWTESVDYGPLWAPRNVAADWAPYRDGRWTWLAPWGWTWVDNAPWGYAPSHYGRWVTVRDRWYWAPGRPVGRPVWSPALVGWVGGVDRPQQGPGLGWYPLSPRDRYVPNYRVSVNVEQRLTWINNGKPYAPRDRNYKDNRDNRDGRDYRHGLTVLPRAQFEGRHTVRVNRSDQFVPRGQQISQVSQITPVAPPQPTRPGRIETNRRGVDRDGDGRPDRFERNDQRNDQRSDQRNDQRGDQRGRLTTQSLQPAQPMQPPAMPGGQRDPRRSQTISTLPPQQIGTPDAPAQTINPRDVGIELYPRGNGGRPGNGATMPAPVLHINPTRERFQRNDNDDQQRGDEQQRRWRRDEQRGDNPGQQRLQQQAQERRGDEQRQQQDQQRQQQEQQRQRPQQSQPAQRPQAEPQRQEGREQRRGREDRQNVER